jgi:hypothetical protein
VVEALLHKACTADLHCQPLRGPLIHSTVQQQGKTRHLAMGQQHFSSPNSAGYMCLNPCKKDQKAERISRQFDLSKGLSEETLETLELQSTVVAPTSFIVCFVDVCCTTSNARLYALMLPFALAAATCPRP